MPFVAQRELDHFQVTVETSPQVATFKCLLCGWEEESMSLAVERGAQFASPMSTMARGFREMVKHRSNDCPG